MADPYTCYNNWDNTIGSDPNWLPCGPVNSTNAFVQCCAKGDTCMEGGICATTSHQDLGGSGYYMSGCTDPNYVDQSCPSQCVNNLLPDAVYSIYNTTWGCCQMDIDAYDAGSSNYRQCWEQTSSKWSAPMPQMLKVIGMPTNFSDPSTSQTSNSSSSSTPNSAPSNNSSGVSTGAAAGIGVGCGIAGILIGSIIVLCIMLSKQRREHRQGRHEPADSATQLYPPQMEQSGYGAQAPPTPHGNDTYAPSIAPPPFSHAHSVDQKVLTSELPEPHRSAELPNEQTHQFELSADGK